MSIIKHINNVYEDLDIKFLTDINKKVIIFDLDNTLVDSDYGVGFLKTNKFLKKIQSNGFRVVIASNNYKKRVELFKHFCDVKGITYISYSLKPFPFLAWRVLRRFNIRKQELLLIGDQVFTDVLSAKLAGVDVILTKPLNKKENLQKKVIRFLERKIIHDR